MADFAWTLGSGSREFNEGLPGIIPQPAGFDPVLIPESSGGSGCTRFYSRVLNIIMSIIL
jgi:hypothetical protein